MSPERTHEILDLGQKYDPGLSFGEIPHLFWKYSTPRVIRYGHSFEPQMGKGGAVFCRVLDIGMLNSLLHMNLKPDCWVKPDRFRVGVFGAVPFSRHWWDIWIYDPNWSRMISCRTMFSSFEEEQDWLSKPDNGSFCAQYNMAPSFFLLFQAFYKTWSPKSSLAYMARLASE